MKEVLEFCFRDFTTWGGITLWMFLIGTCAITIAQALAKYWNRKP